MEMVTKIVLPFDIIQILWYHNFRGEVISEYT